MPEVFAQFAPSLQNRNLDVVRDRQGQHGSLYGRGVQTSIPDRDFLLIADAFAQSCRERITRVFDAPI